MSKKTVRPATGFECLKKGPYQYEISWVVDNQIMGEAMVKPRRTSKLVDDVAAKRFCKKWKISFPLEEEKNHGWYRRS